MAFIVFIPRKTFSVTGSGLKVYHPKDTRPISLSNTFTKLIAITLKAALCNIVDAKITLAQKCVAGRNLLENVVALDTAMHIFAIKGLPFAAGFLWDFFSAFPSVDHDFLWQVMTAAGLPKELIRAVKKLYKFNCHLIKLAGKTYKGPTVLAGVKQGCPLSMVLFALCIEDRRAPSTPYQHCHRRRRGGCLRR